MRGRDRLRRVRFGGGPYLGQALAPRGLDEVAYELLPLSVYAALRRPDERVEVEGGSAERERGVHGLDAAEFAEARVNQPALLEEEGAGAFGVLDL